MAEPEITGWCFGCGPACGCQVYWPGAAKTHWREWPGVVCAGPVWPGVRVHDQAEADRLIPELLAIDAPGRWVEWVPGRGSLDLSPRMIGDSVLAPLGEERSVDCGGCRGTPIRGLPYCPGHEAGGVLWLRIAADPDGPLVDFADVRAMVAQARDAGVPVWIDGVDLGHCYVKTRISKSRVIHEFPFVSASGISRSPAEWPIWLRDCRELPEAER